jgi:hypothetical protein
MESEKDKLLWKEARKRVSFRNHLVTYIVINIFFWALWYFTDRRSDHHGLPWPTFCTLGWGFGLLWHFIAVYFLGNKVNRVEKEYQKLKDKQG